MNIEVKELEPCKLAVIYEANAEQIMNKRGEVMDAFKKAPVKGFRPGKASMDAIRNQYKSQIEDSLKRGLAEDAYHNTLFEKKLRAHGAPQFNSMLLEGGRFVCEFSLYTKPDFELFNYKGMTIPKPPTSTIAEISEKMLQELRIKFGEMIPFTETDFIQMGDNIILDYEGFINGNKIDNLCAEGEVLTIGRSLLPSFDESLLGMTLGEVREFDLTVPEGSLPSLAGQMVHFKCTLSMGSKNIPAPLNDELAKKMSMTTFEEVRELVNGSATARFTENNKKMLVESLANRLVQDNPINVPNWMTLSEAQYLAHQSKLEWDKMTDIDKEKYMELSEKNVKLSLILDKVREDEPEAQLSDQEVFDIIKRNLANTKVQTSLDDVIKEMQRTGYLQILFSRIKDEQAIDFILKNTNIVE